MPWVFHYFVMFESIILPPFCIDEPDGLSYCMLSGPSSLWYFPHQLAWKDTSFPSIQQSYWGLAPPFLYKVHLKWPDLAQYHQLVVRAQDDVSLRQLSWKHLQSSGYLHPYRTKDEHLWHLPRLHPKGLLLCINFCLQSLPFYRSYWRINQINSNTSYI